MNTLTIAQIMEKMIAFSEGNIHDIDHLIRVWTYAKTIGELEGLDANTQYILEVFFQLADQFGQAMTSSPRSTMAAFI